MIGYRKMLFLGLLAVLAFGAGLADLIGPEALASVFSAIALAFGAGNASEHLGTTVARLVQALQARKKKRIAAKS